MPLKDWGLGLEEITDYYHRYGLYYTDFGLNKESQNWFITRGVVDQTPKSTVHKKSKKKFGFWSPMEIDLVGFWIDHKCKIKEVRIIQCKENIETSMVPQIADSMLMPRLGGLSTEAQKQKILTKYVSYVTISEPAKKRLVNNGIKLLSFNTMIEKLLQMIIGYEKMKRKGFSMEPGLWMLRSLKFNGFFDEKLIKKIEKRITQI